MRASSAPRPRAYGPLWGLLTPWMFRQMFGGYLCAVNRGYHTAFAAWLEPTDPVFLIDQSPRAVDPLLALVRLCGWAKSAQQG